MSTITRLVAGKKNQSRVNIYCDGSFAFALSLDEVVKRSLKKGQDLTEEQIAELKNLDDFATTYAKILNYLSFRPRSQYEVVTKLKKMGKSDDLIKSICAKLTEKNYLSDLSFAQWFVESRRSNRPRSTIHLTAELKSHGISAELIRQVLDPSIDEEAITQVIYKKIKLPKPKLVAYLARRGFGYALIQSKLDELGIKE